MGGNERFHRMFEKYNKRPRTHKTWTLIACISVFAGVLVVLIVS